jgi:acetylglutamate kinase
VACAIHLRAERLIFMTDVDGVRDQAGRTIRAMASDEIPGLLQSGTVTGGMLAKLNAIQEALAGGISGVHICNGHVDGALDAGILQSDGGSRHPGSEEEFNQASGTMVFSSTPSRDEEAVDARSLNRIG